MPKVFLAELLGTLILVTIGDAVVANVLLSRTKGHHSGWIVITTAWGLAVAVAAYSVGRVSGAHLNPAVTLAVALSDPGFDWSKIPIYLTAQMLGGFLAGILVWLHFFPHWQETDDAGAKLGVFCTAPAIRHVPSNLGGEVLGTALLVFGILAIGANAGELSLSGGIDLQGAFKTALSPLLVGFLVWAIGLSLGGTTGYAINPARDLGPRLAHALLPIPGKRDPDWSYAWIPVAGPLLGGLAAALVYRWTGF
jgi:glycerol uptake facilitator protein